MAKKVGRRDAKAPIKPSSKEVEKEAQRFMSRWATKTQLQAMYVEKVRGLTEGKEDKDAS